MPQNKIFGNCNDLSNLHFFIYSVASHAPTIIIILSRAISSHVYYSINKRCSIVYSTFRLLSTGSYSIRNLFVVFWLHSDIRKQYLLHCNKSHFLQLCSLFWVKGVRVLAL